MHGRLVQLIALITMIAALAGSGSIVPGIVRDSERYTLRYTDAAVENAPPIVAIGTSIGALRGIIVDVLWLRVTIMKERGLYYEAMTAAELITQLQPRFAPVWAFHGHNMAYNISVATHTQQERWQWVNKGINLVRNQGLRYNPNDVELHKELAFWLAHKIEGLSDDAHLYYKRMFAREWHMVLGEPPAAYDARVEWIRQIAEAPETLDDAERRSPGVRAMVSELRERLNPFDRVQFQLDRQFLESYAWWRASKETRFAQARGIEENLRRIHDANETSNPLYQTARLYVVLDDIFGREESAEATETLIAFARKQVLRNEYNMDPQLMYEYTRDLGPIDWRHASAHSLYWSRRGSQVGERRSRHEDDIYKIINNDRMQGQAMQDLARTGLIIYDVFSEDVPSRLPDNRWIAVLDRFFEQLYVKHHDVRGWGSDNFIALHENFLKSSMRQLYRRGDMRGAEQILARLDSLYGMGAVPPNPDYSLPLDVLVRRETLNEYEMQPFVAITDVQSALYYAIRAGLGRGNTELYEEARQFSNFVLRYFKENEYNNFVTKFGEGRISDLIGQLEQVELEVFGMMMMDQGIPLDERLRIYHYYSNEAVQRRVYDAIRPEIERQLRQNPALARLSINEVLPEPPGMSQFREQQRRLLQQRQEQQDPDSTIIHR